MNIEFEIDPNEKDVQTIYDGLVGFNEPTFGALKVEDYACFIRNDDGKILGGATGGIVGEVALLKYFWIDDSLRGQGQGRQVFELLEVEFRKRNVSEIHLDTYSFQAPDFYIKLGFKEVARYMFMKQQKYEKIFFIKEL